MAMKLLKLSLLQESKRKKISYEYCLLIKKIQINNKLKLVLHKTNYLRFPSLKDLLQFSNLDIFCSGLHSKIKKNDLKANWAQRNMLALRKTRNDLWDSLWDEFDCLRSSHSRLGCYDNSDRETWTTEIKV